MNSHIDLYRHPLLLLNTTIATTDGTYELESIGALDAAALFYDFANLGAGVDSAIGHESTAEVMSTVLRSRIDVNRQVAAQQSGQHALVFKLHGRAPEGVVLSTEEVEAIGYSWKLLTLRDDAAC